MYISHIFIELPSPPLYRTGFEEKYIIFCILLLFAVLRNNNSKLIVNLIFLLRYKTSLINYLTLFRIYYS